MEKPDHILVVDDDLGLRELLDRYFVGNGYRVTTVANGRQMREVLANHRVDLIVLDLARPGTGEFVLHPGRRVIVWQAGRIHQRRPDNGHTKPGRRPAADLA